MPAYQTKVLAVTAVLWDGTVAGAESLATTLALPFHSVTEQTQGKALFQIGTGDGVATVPSGNYVVKHADGTFSICDAAEFAATYEAAP